MEDPGAAGSDDSLSAQHLERQIAWLRSIGPIVPLHEAFFEPNGHGARFAVVFDDATVSVVRHAAPLMARERVPWTIAVPTALVQTGEPNWRLHFRYVLHRTRVTRLSIPWDAASAPEIVQLPADRGAALDRFQKLHFSTQAFDSRRVLRSVLEQLPADDPALELPEDLRTSDPDGLRTCVEAGATLVSHGAHHVPLAAVEHDVVLAEWNESRRWLSTHFGTVADTSVLVTPYGHAVPLAADGLLNAGCRFVVTGIPGVLSASSDPFRIPRLSGFSRTVPGLAARIARAARAVGADGSESTARGDS